MTADLHGRHRRDPARPRSRSRPASRELGARSRADYAGRPLTLVSVLKGSLPFMADLMRAIDAPAPDRPHGGLVLRRRDDRVVRPRPDPQGPLVEHRGRGRPDRRGHHRHRPDAELPRPLPARQEARRRSGSAPCSTSRPGASSRSTSTTPASRSRTSSSSATASTTASSTATCASSASCGPRSTRPPNERCIAGPSAAARLLAALGALVIARRLRPAVVDGRRRPTACPRSSGNAFEAYGHPRLRRRPSRRSPW